MGERNNNKSLISMIFGFIIGLVVCIVATVVLTKTYGLSIKEYQELYEFKNMTESMFYQDTSDVDFMDGVKKGIVESLNDPYSRYLNPEEFKRMLEDTSGNFVGVGIYIAPNDDNQIVVIAPIKNSPAEKSGIVSGDIIATVDGKEYNGKKLDDAVKAMRGEEGKIVKVGVINKDGKFKEHTIKREKIQTETVESEVKEDNIGYIHISSFEEKTGEEFRKHYAELKTKNLIGLIIDLRSNPGGLLDQVQDVADQILPKAVIAYANDRKGKKEYFNSDDKESIKLPMVVLVNGNSASSSEILSGALQDNKKATIVGETTFGKGLIQSIIRLSDGSGLVITTAQYFTPNGNAVNKKGITPDVVVKSELNTKDKDAQLQKALEILKK